ncbi:hypothetical protein Tco_1010689 [Tanacetum coccineum]
MSDQKFADTHNLVAFFEKPTESEGFEEIVDFLNANLIKYALTINPTIYCSCIKQFWDIVKAKMVNGEVQLQALVDKKKVIITESTIKRDLQLEDANGVDCLPNAVIFEQLTLMGYEKLSQKLTFYKAFFSPQWKFLIHTILQYLKHIADEVANEENVPIQSNDPPLSRVNILGSGENRLSLKELMDLCTKLSDRVLNLETTKTAQAKEIASLKKRVKKLERKKKSKTLGMKRLFKIGRSAQVVSSKDEGLGDQEDASKQERKIANIDVDAEVTFIDETQGRNDDNLMYDRGVLDEQEVEVEKPSEFTTITTTTTPAASKPLQDKGKAKMIESEEPLKMKPKDQVLFDEQEAIRLQAQFDEEERIVREKEEVNIALIAQWNDIQDKVETDYELAQRLRKHFTAKRAKERRRKPPTKAQQRKGSEIREEESSSKRADDELKQEHTKKQKVDDDKEREDLQQCFELVTEEDVAIDAIPLATKPAPIVNFQIHRKGRNGYYEIMRADGSDKTYLLPEEGYERVLWGDIKTMFEHRIEDEVWRSLQGNKVLLWRLYDSCGVHFVRFEDMHVYMLVEKRYPLTPETITDMLNKKLKSDY